MKNCKIDNCSSPVKGRGWCTKHYLRWWRHGDPLELVSHSTERGTPTERFWRLVAKAGDTDCWTWLGKKGSKGYGLAHVADGRQRQAHRVAYELVVGPIPEGLELDHLCNVRRCVNPAHLEAVTHSENQTRRYQRARKVR